MTKQLIRAACWAVACGFIVNSGCGGDSVDQRINAELARTGQIREEVFPLIGKVTVDGHIHTATKLGRRLVVSLYEMSDGSRPETASAVTESKPDGSFAFETLRAGDGVAPGKYVITFAESSYNRSRGYHGPDGLKNLYSDPVKNAQQSEFRIDHHAPGRTDYTFDLKVAGETPIELPAPGPRTPGDR
jgi:hypothetical protein